VVYADSADWSVARLIMGPYCHWAIKFVIDPSLDGRTLHSGRVHIWNPGDSLIRMRLCRGTASNPGVVLDSGSFYATVGHSFYEVPFGDTIILNRGDTIWLWCYQTRITGEWPWTIDSGPAVPGYGDRISFDGAVWEGLNDYGFNSNWVMELILTPVDVEEGPARPREFFMHITSSNPIKGVLRLQYGISHEDEGLVSLKIYDVSGRVVQTVFSEEKSAGYYELSIPTSSFSAGTYFLRLETPKKGLNQEAHNKEVTNDWTCADRRFSGVWGYLEVV